MSAPLKYRSVVVQGQSFEVPTNVYWNEHRGGWIVSVRLDKKSLIESFYPSQYKGSLSAAFEAACSFAVIKRKYPSKEVHVRGFKLSKRSLDNRPALPRGIGFFKETTKDKKPHYVMTVTHEKERVMQVRIGPVDGYTDEQYDRALRIAERCLKIIRAPRDAQKKQLENFRVEAMSHADLKNPFSQLVYSINKLTDLRPQRQLQGDSK